jgi:hypothetical protein
MLSKVVATVATFSVKKDDAQINLDKEQKTFNAAKDNAKVATDEYLASSSQAEKEKQMIYQIRAMVCVLTRQPQFASKSQSHDECTQVIRLNQGKATLEFENCRDAKVVITVFDSCFPHANFGVDPLSGRRRNQIWSV